MATETVERVVKALVGAQFAKPGAPPLSDPRAHILVTISRDHGALGAEVAQRLADVLGAPCADREILEAIAHRARVDTALVESLDRHVASIKSEWWRGLLSGKALTREQFSRNLVKVILSIARHNAVIIGRGAHLILGAGVAFRVRIVGCTERCARRIGEREGLSPDKARERVRSVNRERDEFLRVYFDHPIDDPRSYDLVINSDRFDVEAMVELILLGLRQAGYHLPVGAGSGDASLRA